MVSSNRSGGSTKGGPLSSFLGAFGDALADLMDRPEFAAAPEYVRREVAELQRGYAIAGPLVYDASLPRRRHPDQLAGSMPKISADLAATEAALVAALVRWRTSLWIELVHNLQKTDGQDPLPPAAQAGSRVSSSRR